MSPSACGPRPRRCPRPEPEGSSTGRMTGWGQDEAMAAEAGHDINYIALAGAPRPCGRAGGPRAAHEPWATSGGGAMFLASGRLRHPEARTSARPGGRRRHGRRRRPADDHDCTGMAMGIWNVERGRTCSTPAPFYDTAPRTTSSSSGGLIEPQFYAALVDNTGLGDGTPPPQFDRANWLAFKEQRRRDLPHQDARRVVRAARGSRRLFRRC